MSRLIRLFPRSWRERYADEFEALLDELPGGPRSTVDVVAAAARAHASVSADSVRRVGDQLGGAEAQRAGAAAAIVGGSLWVLTFGVGSLVQWGRYGRDWGFVLLIVAAALVLGAQVVSGTAWQGRGRVVVRVAVGASSLGMAVLVLALIRAMGLEPLSWTLAGWTPPQLWETGMVLWLIGIGLFGSAGIAAGGFARKTGSLMVVAAIPLLAWLVADAPSVREVVVNSLRAANEGLYESIAASVSFRDVSDGWFTSRFLVAGPGVILGIAWLALGRDQLRGAGHGHVPDASESLQSA